MGQWAFAELRGDDVRRDPNESELFIKTEQTAEGEYAEGRKSRKRVTSFVI
jgi:hypothetical protein